MDIEAAVTRLIGIGKSLPNAEDREAAGVVLDECANLRKALEEARDRALHGCRQCWDVVTLIDVALGRRVRVPVEPDTLVEDGSVEFDDAKVLRERGFKRLNKPKRLTPPKE